MPYFEERFGAFPQFLSWDQMLDRLYSVIDVRRRQLTCVAEAHPNVLDGPVHAREQHGIHCECQGVNCMPLPCSTSPGYQNRQHGVLDDAHRNPRVQCPR